MDVNLMRLFTNSTFYASTKVLAPKDRKKIYLVALVQIAMGFVDLAGVAVIGILGALAVNGIQSKGPGERVASVLDLLGLGDQTFQTQAAVLGIIATILLLGRTIFSVFFTRKTLFFLSHKGAKASSELISKLLSQSLLDIQSRTTQQTLFAVTNGVSVIMLGVVGTAVTIIADGSLLIILSVGLFIVDPTMAFGTVLMFVIIGLILYKILNVKAKTLGAKNTQLTIESNEKILEVLNSYRESMVHNRRDHYANEIGTMRYKLGNVLAENAFIPYISKYVIESALVFGGLLLSAVQFLLQDAAQAVATLTVFMAAGSRIAPAALRLQQASLAIKGSLAQAKPTLELMASLDGVELSSPSDQSPDVEHVGFIPTIEVKDLLFKYPNSEFVAVDGQNFSIVAGSSVAVVGSTGAGKTTAVDLILGLLEPEDGSVLISGLKPKDAIVRWPGAISYVPQDVVISNGTIRDNVGLGYKSEFVSEELVWDAIEASQLESYVNSLPLGLDTQVGERGTRMSGGQRQRLGIARALFTKPKLLVLDEATSALDGETEAAISKAVQDLRGSVTVIMIAHRLSTVRNADLVVYMDRGQIKSIGTFEEVRAAVPDFDRQAKLMGL
jgi:ABC-type multidrug transport system fused ATPase/permease subunit